MRYRIYTLARLRFVYFVCQNFNLSRHHKKGEIVLVSLCSQRARNDSWGCVCVWCVCVREYVCQGEKDSRSREREIEGPSKKKKSFLRARENFERSCCLFFFFNFSFTTMATATTTTPLSGDRATRLVVLGSCPYHGTSHEALSLRRRALPMAASGSESTPAVA